MRIALVLLAPAVLLGQNATLSGVVRDAAQSPIAEARVAVSQAETGTERAAKSNSAGLYSVPSLAPGHYKVTVEAKGFAARTVENVELRASQNARLDFTMQRGAVGVRGAVADAHGGEALANVQIRLEGTRYRTTSDESGHFQMYVLPGDYMLNVSTVGYHVERQGFHLDDGETKDFNVVLTSDTLRQTATVTENVDPFEPAHGDIPGPLKLAGTDAKNLGSVLADDPLRAVQALPGVTSNDDFEARFSLRGAGFSQIALYLDGVLLHEPFNEPKTQQTPGTITAFNAGTVEDMGLYEAAFPARFEDRTAGVLDVVTRDGARDSTLFQANASFTDAGVLGEGPFGAAKHGKPKGSWLVAARKSYVQYLLERTNSPTAAVFNLEDLQTRLTYDFTPRNTVTFSVLESFSAINRSANVTGLGLNAVEQGGYHYTLANLGWTYSPNSKLQVVSHAAWMREKYSNTTPDGDPLFGGYYGEWVLNSSATWQWSEGAPLEVGVSIRRIRDQDFSNEYLFAGQPPNVLDHADGTAVRTGGYAQQSWTGLSGRLRLSAGGRWDDQSIDKVAVFSPLAAASLKVTKSTNLLLGWGEYAEYPEIAVLLSPFGNRGLLPARSIHETAALEQRLGPRTRLRAEVYQRDDRDLPYQPFYLPQIFNGAPVYSTDPLYYNSLRGRSRGFQVFLQRSSANRFTGWISYAYGRDPMHDSVTGESFFSDYDQRHTVNAYGSYRLRPTVSLSLRESYGSGFPIPAFLQRDSHGFYILAAGRDELRLPAYQRTDLRINKSWVHNKWKFTLYGELLNLTDHANYFYRSSDVVSQSGQAMVDLTRAFPILPSLGFAVEF